MAARRLPLCPICDRSYVAAQNVATGQTRTFHHLAVGTRFSWRAPRTDPYKRLARIRLPPWVCDGEAIARPVMKDGRFREPVGHQLRHPCPGAPILLATPPKRAPPKVGDMVPKHFQRL